MNKKILFLSTILACCHTVYAGLPEALTDLNYEQYSSALVEFQALAEQQNPPALYYLGTMYQNGWGVPKNAQQAFSYFQAADQLFYFPASAQLGKMLLYGIPGEIATDHKRAIELLKKAALSGNAEAAYELGNATMQGWGTDIDYNHAFGYYSIAAVKGEKKAQYQLARIYFLGRGVPQDYSRGLAWMNRAANQGYVKAQIELADLYENDSKLKSIAKAYAWNSILAAYNSDSVGTTAAKKRDELAKKVNTKDLSEQQAAIRSWMPKTPQKSVPAEERNMPLPIIPGFNDAKTLQQILLKDGALPQDSINFGISIEKIDLAEATDDLEPLTTTIAKAMEQGRTKAAAFYADLLLKRFHRPKEAVQWYEKGANAGDPYAQYQLSRAYCEGWASAPDAAKCYAWLLIARDASNPVLNMPIQQALTAVRENATEDELERGKSLVNTIKQADKKKDGILDFF